MFMVNTSMAQKLGINLGLSYNIASNYNMTFSEPYQFLYAAPFGSNLEYTEPVYEQVRLAKIYGVKTKNDLFYIPNFSFSIDYTLKNNFIFSFETNYGFFKKQVFYSFHNLFIDISPNTDNAYTSKDDPALLDNKITISQWRNAYTLKSKYILPTKTITKFFLSTSYTFQYVINSTYNSILKTRKDSYVTSIYDDNSEIIGETVNNNEYLNVVVFQDKIFNEYKNDEFNHLIGLGFGLKRFGYEVSMSYQFSLANQNQYYKNYNQVMLHLKYSLININLFK